jgi:hypothetical protein
MKMIKVFALCLVATYFWGAFFMSDLEWLFPLSQWVSLFFVFFFGWAALFLIPWALVKEITRSTLTADLTIILPPVLMFLVYSA